MSYWAPFLLVTITVVLIVVPVTPALQELYRRQDAGPLPTSRHNGRITNFAESLRSRLGPLFELLESCRASKELTRARVDGMNVLLIGHDHFDFEPEQMRGIEAVMCSASASIPPGRLVNADVWALGDLKIGDAAVLRAGFAAGNILLGQNSAVLRWLHADGNVVLQCGSKAGNRLSSGQSIRLVPGCCFQHVQAPVIITSKNEVDESESMALSDTAGGVVSELQPEGNDSVTTIEGCGESQFSAARPRMRVPGDFVLPAGENLWANVIATGAFRLQRGASFLGSAKSYKNTVIAEGASVHGSIACGATAQIGPGAFLSGPLLAEGDVYLSNGSCVGRPNSLTTIAAPKVHITAGCRVYGSIWARTQGRVIA